MSNAIRSEGGTKNGAQYNKWGKNQKWARFSSLPGSLGGGKNVWVRVGSQRWSDIQKYNSTAGKHNVVGHGQAGGNSLPPVHPDRKLTSAWNPESPQFRQARKAQNLQDGVNQQSSSQNPSNPTAPNTTKPGKGPGTKPPKNPNGNFGLGSPNVGQTEKLSDADALAGLQFDSQINDARTQLADQHAQGAQDLADIANWYQKIQGQGQANAGANAAAVQRSAGAQDNVTQSLLAAIGGGANSSAGAVAAQGAGASADMRQQGVLQQLFAGNMAQAMAGQQAGQASAQQALNSQTEQSLGTQIRDLLGQRGQAVVQNQQAIRAANNSVANQNYANAISRLEAIVGARTAVGNQKLQGLQLQQAQQQVAGGGAGGFVPFSRQTPAEKFATVKMLVAGGPASNGGLMDINSALARAKASGYDPAIVRPYLQTFYGTAH